MGVNLKDLAQGREVILTELKGKRLAVDAFNMLYQFLSTIRGYDGTLLMDSKGNVTSHLSGLFSRSTKLMQKGVRLAFVFDGQAPELKKKERERRRALKEEAQREYESAEREGSVEEMKKYAQRTARLDAAMIEEAKRLITALGMPVIQAPSEGEAQAAYMVKKGDLDAEISQDFDCLLFGVPRFIQNLTISQRKKTASKLSYETIKPKEITLKETLEELGVTHDQLIVVGILVGTDFNVGGVKGIGPKKALSLVKEYGEDFDALFASVEWEYDYSWKDVFDLFKNMPVTDEYKLDWTPIDREAVVQILVHDHDFNKQRVLDTLDTLEKEQKKLQQKGLGAFM